MILKTISDIVLWFFNIAGLILWAGAFFVSMEGLAKVNFTTWKFWKHWRYWIEWVYIISTFCVVIYRIDDMWTQTSLHYIALRTIAALLIPVAIIIEHRLRGVVISAIQACADFWNGKE